METKAGIQPITIFLNLGIFEYNFILTTNNLLNDLVLWNGDYHLSELNFFWLKYAYGIYQLMLNEIVWKSYAP